MHFNFFPLLFCDDVACAIFVDVQHIGKVFGSSKIATSK